MLIPFLEGTLPGWPESDQFNWPILLAITLGLPMLFLALAWALGSGRTWLKAGPEMAAAKSRALAQVNTHGDEVADLYRLDRTTPDGPNRVLADRVESTGASAAPKRALPEQA